MPICCDCAKDVPKSGFAKSQLKKAPDKRRCKQCARPLSGDQPAHAAQAARDEQEVQHHPCWICLCDDTDDEGGHGPPRRDCSCRGTAGYVHITCLIDMASKKADAIDVSPKNTAMTGLGVSVGGNVLNPWRECLTCRQAYGGETLYQLAKAAEAKYCHENSHAPPFWKAAAYDNLSGVLMSRGDVPGGCEALQQRLELLKKQYRYEVRCGRDRADISCTKDIVNVLVNLAGVIITYRGSGLGSPDDVRMLLDEAQRYADQKQTRDGGYLLAIVWRHRATLEDSLDNCPEALRLMQKAVAVLQKDPGYLTSFNGIRTQWDLSNMMIRAAEEGDGLWAGYELQEQTVATAKRVLGADNPYVLQIATEFREFQERMGEEWIEFGRAFRGMNLNDTDNITAHTKEEGVLATGFCYTGQPAKITGMTDAGYRALLLSEEKVFGILDTRPLIDPNSNDDDWEASFVPFPAICLDNGTWIVLHGYDTKDEKCRNGKVGVVRGFEFLNNETHNFDKILLQVDVDGDKERLLVSPKNAKLLIENID